MKILYQNHNQYSSEAKRLKALYMDAGCVMFRSQELDEEMPEP